MELILYAKDREVNFSATKSETAKKNSSRSELTKEIYKETNTKLFLLTPILLCRAIVIPDKSNTFLKEKYVPIITIKTPMPRNNDIKSFVFKTKQFLRITAWSDGNIPRDTLKIK